MTMLLIYAAALLVAVLVSDLAYRSVLSTAVLFLVVGWVVGTGGFGWIQIAPEGPEVARLADLALFSILFTDGMRISLRDLAGGWQLPFRALAIGFPLTLLGTAVAAHYISGLGWLGAVLVGAILTPTDPVFAAAIVGREEIPRRLRQMLNVESGVNDGLALPLVLGLLALLGSGPLRLGALGGEVLWGIILGFLVAYLALRLARSSLFSVHESHRPLFSFAVGMLIFTLAAVTHANSYLGAFTGGVTMVSIRPHTRKSFHPFAEPLTELLKLAALLVFGAVISQRLVHDITARDYLFGLIALVLVRPLALAVSLAGSSLTWRETLVAGWFGPKGFASVVYALFILQYNPPGAEHMAHLVAIVTIGSIIAHSSTDVLIARWFKSRGGELPE